MNYKVYEPKQQTIRIRVVNENEFEAYVEEMPTVRAFGKTRAEAWANCVYLTIHKPEC